MNRQLSTPVRLNQGESISLLTGQVVAPAKQVAPANLLLEIALGQNDLRGLAMAFKIATTRQSGFKIGDTVTHRHYGQGSVIAFRGADRTVVQFRDHDGYHGRVPLIIWDYELVKA